ncbi:MAG TPA: hypothetical protein VKG45_09785, partial [Actinomycetes bacterium]|nr:hypothetical protein [Actinomycetes bacterium]
EPAPGPAAPAGQHRSWTHDELIEAIRQAVRGGSRFPRDARTLLLWRHRITELQRAALDGSPDLKILDPAYKRVQKGLEPLMWIDPALRGQLANEGRIAAAIQFSQDPRLADYQSVDLDLWLDEIRELRQSEPAGSAYARDLDDAASRIQQARQQAERERQPAAQGASRTLQERISAAVRAVRGGGPYPVQILREWNREILELKGMVDDDSPAGMQLESAYQRVRRAFRHQGESVSPGRGDPGDRMSIVGPLPGLPPLRPPAATEVPAMPGFGSKPAQAPELPGMAGTPRVPRLPGFRVPDVDVTIPALRPSLPQWLATLARTPVVLAALATGTIGLVTFVAYGLAALGMNLVQEIACPVCFLLPTPAGLPGLGPAAADT